MRTVKFRAWHKLNNYMCLVTGLSFEPLQVCIGSASIGKTHIPLQCFPIDEMELMQFAGLLDKNGREVYEGDIVRLESGYLTDVWEVYWSEDRWGLRDSNQGDYDNGDYYHGDQITWKDAEIIGNIYENPDLLE